jgi:HEAT repeat protein
MPFLSGLFTPNVEKMQTKGDVDGLLKILETDYLKNPDLQHLTVQALGELKDVRATPKLLSLYRNNQITPIFRQFISKALQKIADPASAGELILYLESLKRDDWINLTTEILDQIDPDTVIRAVLERMTKNNKACYQSSKLLAKYGKRAALPIIETLLNYKSIQCWDNCGSLFVCLGEIHDPQVSNSLIDMVQTAAAKNEIWVLASALQALGRAGGANCFEIISPFLAHKESKIRESAIYGLKNLKDPRAVHPLLQLMETSDALTKKEITKALDQIGVKPDINVVRNKIVDPSESMREAAVGELQLIGGTEAFLELIPLLQDPSDLVAHLAAMAMQKIDYGQYLAEAKKVCSVQHRYLGWGDYLESQVAMNKSLKNMRKRECYLCGAVEQCSTHTYEIVSFETDTSTGEYKKCQICGYVTHL